MWQKKNNNTLARKLFSGAAWAFFAKLIGIVSGLIVNALLARLLTTSEMGLYFLTVSMVMLFSILTRLGLKQAIVKIVATSLTVSHVGNIHQSLNISYGLIFAMNCMFGMVYYLFLDVFIVKYIFSYTQLLSASGLIVIWVLLLGMQLPVSEGLRGLHRINFAVFFDGVLASVLVSLILIYFWFSNRPLAYINTIYISLVALFIVIAIGTLILIYNIKRLSGNRNGSIKVNDILLLSLPLYVVDISNYLIDNFGLWIVAMYLTDKDVAYYGAAWKLVALISMPLLLINMSIQPIIADLYSRNKKESLNNALRGTATMAAIPSLFVLFLIIYYRNTLLELVYGFDYIVAADVLLVLCLGHFVNVLTGSCGWVMAFTGHHKILMFIKLLSAVVSLLIAIIAVQLWGSVGVASVVAGITIIQSIITWIVTWKLTGLWTHASFEPRFVYNAANKLIRKSI